MKPVFLMIAWLFSLIYTFANFILLGGITREIFNRFFPGVIEGRFSVLSISLFMIFSTVITGYLFFRCNRAIEKTTM